jgi:polyhydroxybutyrate depolymerase
MTIANMNACSPNHPTPIMQIHGTADGTVPYLGNSFMVATETLITNWVNENNCNATPITINVPNISTTDGCTATHYTYTGGTNGSTVEFYKVTGGGHTWPGAPIAIGVTNMDFSASKEIWRFFSQFSMGQLLSIEEQKENGFFSAYPNPSNGSFLLNFKDNSLKEINVFNNLGQLVLSKVSADQNIELNLVNQTGVFLVQVITENGQLTKKIIIQ